MELTVDGRCPTCNTELQEARGQYFCPWCLLCNKIQKIGKNVANAFSDKKPCPFCKSTEVHVINGTTVCKNCCKIRGSV